MSQAEISAERKRAECAKKIAAQLVEERRFGLVGATGPETARAARASALRPASNSFVPAEILSG